MAQLGDIVFDSPKPSAIAAFWAAALDGYEIRAYDDEEIARLAALGFTPETDPSVMVDGPGPTLCFQLIREEKVAKNRLHLDLRTTDRSGEVSRLLELGATVHQEQDDLTTLLDPDGNEFCVIQER